jgi:hypothetical protein
VLDAAITWQPEPGGPALNIDLASCFGQVMDAP